MLDSSHSNETNVLALYGVDSSTRAVELFFFWAVNWFQALGYSPQRLAVHWPDRRGKYVSFARASSKLLEAGFSNVSGLSVLACDQGGPGPSTGHAITALFDRQPFALCAAVAARSSVLELLGLPQSCHELISALRPAYGIAYCRPDEEGPLMFAIGLSQGSSAARGGEAYEEALAVSRWGDVGMPNQVYRDGLLRGVFEVNLLADSHLARRVGDWALGDWIRSAPYRGNLLRFSQGLHLWQVESAQLSLVADELWDLGTIFDWRRHIY